MNNSFIAGKIVGEKLYFSMMYADALCCMDLANMHYDVIEQFGIEEGIKIYHKTCHLYNQKLYFIPKESREIHIYDLTTKQIDNIPLPAENVNDPCDGIFYNNHFWIFPSMREDDLIEVDLNTGKIEIIVDFRTDFNRYEIRSESSLIFHRIAQVDNIVWLPVFKSKKLISYDMDYRKMDVYDVCETITGAFTGSDCLWLGTVKENRILKWNYTEKCVEDVVQTSMPSIDMTGPSGIYEYGNLLIIVPGYGKEIHIVDMIEEQDSVVYKMNDVKNEHNPLFVHSEINNNKLYVFPYNNEKMLIIDLGKRKTDTFSLVSDTDMSKYISLNNKEIILENDHISLTDFIGALTK